MKLTCHRAMALTQSYLKPSQLVPCYQWRTMGSNNWSCSLSFARFKFSLKSVNYLAESNGESVVHWDPHVVSSREWLERKVGQSRCRLFSPPGVRIVGIAKLQLGTEQEHKISYEELGRYGIDESDYADSMGSPLRPQVSDLPETRTLYAITKRKAENGFAQTRKVPYEVVDKTQDDLHTEVSEHSDDSEVEGNDWCTYLILSQDKRKTYLGITANLTRRLRQHNGELAGGAKSARGGRPWSLVCTVRGFGTRSEACQFEWRLRKFSKGCLQVDDALSEEIPTNYQGSHVILRRWAAFKKVLETMEGWKPMRVEWH